MEQEIQKIPVAGVRYCLSAAVDIIFCFGFAIPSAQMLTVRPLSIGIADMGDKFTICFREAPMQPANQAMEARARGLRKN